DCRGRTSRRLRTGRPPLAGAPAHRARTRRLRPRDPHRSTASARTRRLGRRRLRHARSTGEQGPGLVARRARQRGARRPSTSSLHDRAGRPSRVVRCARGNRAPLGRRSPAPERDVMKLADFVLRLLLSRRNRETVSGDLLEEYRENVLPAKGRLRAAIWYWRQVLSFVSPLTMGLVFGAMLGVANLIDTAVEPLADDSAGQMLFFFAVVVAIWTAMAFVAARRTQSFWQAIVAGALVGAATLFVFGAANTIRVNVFLDEIQYREDWRHLMARFHESGST